MPRPDRSNERRRRFTPIMAETFARLGYRRATTAALAGACGVQETVLYRLWPDKRAMFIAAIEHVYDLSVEKWDTLIAATGDGRSPAERLLEYEATHHGEFGMYRIVFAGLNESDDPEIHAALCRMYSRYQSFIVRRLREHRGGGDHRVDGDLSAWALIGLGTITSIARELGLLTPVSRRQLWETAGRHLLDGRRAGATEGSDP
jgi:AcrR family transcriptional regulator